MEESFVLLSTMSPKVKSKSYIKSSSVLALKKNIRRSSFCDKLVRTQKIEDLHLIESSSSESVKSFKILNETPIVLSDTSLESSEEGGKSPEKSRKVTNNYLLSCEKMKEIDLWIKGVNRNEEIETSKYSELSTIYGDEDGNFQPKEKGNAISSTFIGSHNTKFDEYLNLKRHKQDYLHTNDITEDLQQKLIIDDSFENCNSDPIQTGNYDLSKENQEENSFHTADNSNNNSQLLKEDSKNTTPKCNVGEIEEIGSLLDSIYGKKWREKQDQILPKTEYKEPHKKSKINITHSERKPKESLLYKNPYLDSEQTKSENLLQKLHRSKLIEKTESPIVQKIYEICDSDTPSESSPIKPIITKARLIFDDSSEDEQSDRNKNDKCTESTDDEKENFDISDHTRSLEERIRKKMLNFPDVSNKIKTKKKDNQNSVKIKKKNVLLEDKQMKGVVKSNKSGKSTKVDVLKSRNENKKISSGSSNISFSSDDEEEWDRRISTITFKRPTTTESYSFLASLSGSVPLSKCDMSARIYRNNFKNFKDQLLTKLFSLYNEKVFDNSIPRDSLLEWNDRMRGTAGFCYCKKITHRNGLVERTVRITLSTKVVDCAERLRDTLIHEMCHAAAWIINCVSDGHGKYWKHWAFKAMKTFPELPPIKRCHDYVINTKYTYKCTGCGYSIGRHSKSLDIERKRCGYCYGKFEVLLNKVSKKGETKSVPATPKKELNGFALFVKENYGSVKTADLKHGEVMKLLGQKFQQVKLSNKT